MKNYEVTLQCGTVTKTITMEAWSLQDVSMFAIPNNSRVIAVEELSSMPNNVGVYNVKIRLVDQNCDIQQMSSSAQDAINMAYPAKVRIVNIVELPS